MTWSEASRPKSIVIDAALVAVLVVGANLLIDRAHPGWGNLNPSPYLLIPLLLGGRYGFTTGVLSGAATSLLIVVLQVILGAKAGAPSAASGGLTTMQTVVFTSDQAPVSVGAALAAAPFLYTSLIFIGGIAGELFGWFRRERAQASAQLEKLNTSVRRLDSDVRYLRGVKDELDRVVAARDGEVSALDTELRRLYACAVDDLPSEVLQFLKRQVRLGDAAVYAVGTDGQPLRRLAQIGRDQYLPASLAAADSPVIRLALSRLSLVMLPELLQQKDPPESERVLLAAPMRDASGRPRALLVVTGLPFVSFNTQSANLISLICDWAGEAFDLAADAGDRYRLVTGRTPQRVFNPTHFQHLLGLALQAHQKHRLPSSVIVLSLPTVSATEQSRFEKALLGAVRAGDYAAELGRPHPHLAVLLPLVGERGASIFVERCRQFLKQAGPWPAEVSIRRVEFGRATTVAELNAEIDAPEPAKTA